MTITADVKARSGGHQPRLLASLIFCNRKIMQLLFISTVVLVLHVESTFATIGLLLARLLTVEVDALFVRIAEMSTVITSLHLTYLLVVFVTLLLRFFLTKHSSL